MPTLPQLIEEDIGELNSALQELLIKSDAGVTLIIDKGGFIITQCGRGPEFDTMTLAALSAASYAATEGIAQVIGEPNFSSVYQQGDTYAFFFDNGGPGGAALRMRGQGSQSERKPGQRIEWLVERGRARVQEAQTVTGFTT